MKKTWELEDLDCANCAAKLEDALNKISGVQEATVSFMSQKLTIEADENELERILDEAEKIIDKMGEEIRIVR